jgi:hypothetical protein
MIPTTTCAADAASGARLRPCVAGCDAGTRPRRHRDLLAEQRQGRLPRCASSPDGCWSPSNASSTSCAPGGKPGRRRPATTTTQSSWASDRSCWPSTGVVGLATMVRIAGATMGQRTDDTSCNGSRWPPATAAPGSAHAAAQRHRPRPQLAHRQLRHAHSQRRPRHSRLRRWPADCGLPAAGPAHGRSASRARLGGGQLSHGAAHYFQAGPVKQTVVEMKRGFLFVMASSDGSCLAVLTAATSDVGGVGYQMATWSPAPARSSPQACAPSCKPPCPHKRPPARQPRHRLTPRPRGRATQPQGPAGRPPSRISIPRVDMAPSSEPRQHQPTT